MDSENSIGVYRELKDVESHTNPINRSKSLKESVLPLLCILTQRTDQALFVNMQQQQQQQQALHCISGIASHGWMTTFPDNKQNHVFPLLLGDCGPFRFESSEIQLLRKNKCSWESTPQFTQFENEGPHLNIQKLNYKHDHHILLQAG